MGRNTLQLGLLGALLLFIQIAGGQPVITSQPANPPVVWGGNATFSVTATGVGPLSYQWQLNGTNLPNNLITTVAGGQLFDHQPATNSILASAAGAALDQAGNLYVADTGNNVIRKLDTNGLMTIVAGNGYGSFAGDGGAATNASLYGPSAVIVDSYGNLLIADSANNRIRRVSTNGIITTLAGSGLGDIISSNVISYGDYGPATNGAISYPVGLCLDTTGNLFIADQQNNRIRKVGTDGIITTVAGRGLTGMGGYSGDGFSATFAQLNSPSGVAVDSSNNVFIADTFNSRIRKVNASGIISTVVGNGTAGYSGDGGKATSAKINNPRGVAVDTNRNVFIVDSGNHCIRKMTTNNNIATIAGNGTNGYTSDGGVATNGNLSGPQGVAVDGSGNLFIADTGNSRIRKVGTNGVIVTVAGRILNDGDSATNATLNSAWAVAADAGGNIYIADMGNNRIRRVDTKGVITTVAGNGVPAYAGDGGAATNAKLWWPYGVTVDAAGNCFIADDYNKRIRKVDTNGNISTVAGNGSFGFSGDGGAATNASFYTPYNVTADSLGNLFIADQFNFRIRKVDSIGTITTVAGNGGTYYSGDGLAATNASLNSLFGIAADAVGNLFIADGYPGNIRKVSTQGIITTIAGTGLEGFSGEGGTAMSAALSSPHGLAMGRMGNLLVADLGNNRIRKIACLESANQPTFTLTNATTDSLTNHYSVIITSASGSVTSSVATVSLQLPPVTPAFTATNGLLTFQWSAVANLTYQMQYTTQLVPPAWTDLGSPTTATNNSVLATDVLGTNSQRFYRVRLWP